jgi:fumarate hydratase class II
MNYTESSKRVFLSTGTKFPSRLIWAVAAVKRAAAEVNVRLGLLPKELGEAIVRASQEVMQGKHHEEVVVDVFQTGSGTGLNMNLNEIIAERASALSGRRVHPNDHVNMGQSSNDVIPTAIRLAAIAEAESSLLPSLREFVEELDSLSRRTSSVYKAGRTHFRDALPVTMGQEFSGFRDAFQRDLRLVGASLDEVRALPIGGTAVGTGLNSHPSFGEMVVKELSTLTGLQLRRANPFTSMKLLTDLVSFSSSLRTVALDLYRLSQDLRLMFSGPITGLGEVDIPTQEEIAGSSIMPGKTNPVTVEATMLACAQVMGLDHANQVAGMFGEFELSMGVPLMGYNVVNQVLLLSEALRKTRELVLSKLVPNEERCKRYAESSPSLITILSPVIGYDRAAEIGKRLNKGISIREALKEMGYSEQEIEELLNMENLVKPGIPVLKGR